MQDNINHPSHYADNKVLGHECIDISGLMPFRLGNAFKYVWRAESKGSFEQDLDKAVFYLKSYLSKQAIPLLETSAFCLDRLIDILMEFNEALTKAEEEKSDPGLRFHILLKIIAISGSNIVEFFNGVNEIILLIKKYKEENNGKI